MFTLEVETGLELALVEPSFAAEYLNLVKENRENLSEWLAWPAHAKNEEFFLAFIEKSLSDYAQGKSLTCAICVNGQVAGNVSLNSINRELKKVGIGYWLGSKYQGKGIVTKSVVKLIELAFEKFKVEKVQISAAEQNRRSRKVCERLGFTLEGIITQAENLNGRIVDHAVYGLHRASWEQK